MQMAGLLHIQNTKLLSIPNKIKSTVHVINLNKGDKNKLLVGKNYFKVHSEGKKKLDVPYHSK